jgi:UDP-N-acetylglucosamine 1-carboxyvinyltransferase
MAASILCPCETELINCPLLSDVTAAANILRYLGCEVQQEGDVINISSRGVCRSDVPDVLMREMRSSVLFLGAILARTGGAELSFPGGCRLGERPIDLHLSALRALGAEIEEQGDRLICRADGLHGAAIPLAMPSVGATENAMIAACGASGTTVIENAAREPEIIALQGYLRAMGAEISGAGTGRVVIDGFTSKDRVGYRIMPDRIAATSWLSTVAATGGVLRLTGAQPEHLKPVTDALGGMGAEIELHGGEMILRSHGRLRPAGMVVTRPYPGFPTDAQPLVMASCLKADGSSVFVENIFENRYCHIEGFRKMGARIQTEGRVALVTGVPKLNGAQVLVHDLRGGAALMAAALSAEGESLVIDDGEHIARGYENIEQTLGSLGAEISAIE